MKRNRVQDLPVSAYMSTDLVTATPDDTLGDVLGKMKSNDVHELPVLERKKLAGVVTMRELMRRRNLPPTTKVSTVLEIAPEINPDTALPEAAEKMISAGFRAVPVVKGKSLIGIVSRSDIVRALVDTRAVEGVAVREFMTRITNRGFIIGLLIMPAFAFLIIKVVPRIMNAPSPEVRGDIAVVDGSGQLTAELRKTLDPAYIQNSRVRDAIRRLAESGGVQGAAGRSGWGVRGDRPDARQGPGRPAGVPGARDRRSGELDR